MGLCCCGETISRDFGLEMRPSICEFRFSRVMATTTRTPNYPQPVARSITSAACVGVFRGLTDRRYNRFDFGQSIRGCSRDRPRRSFQTRGVVLRLTASLVSWLPPGGSSRGVGSPYGAQWKRQQ